MSENKLPAYQETLGLLGKLSARRASTTASKSAPRWIAQVQDNNGWNLLLGGLASNPGPGQAEAPPPPTPQASPPKTVVARFQGINWERRRVLAPSEDAVGLLPSPLAALPPTVRRRFESVNWDRAASWSRSPRIAEVSMSIASSSPKPTVQRFFAGIQW